jgi:hypothetical protein
MSTCFVLPCKNNGGGGGGCPCPYPSHYNTTDGTTNGIILNTAVSNRYVAVPGAFNTGGWDDNLTHPCTHINTIHYNTQEVVLFETQSSDFEVTVYDANGKTVIAYNIINTINGNTTSTNQGITIDIQNYAASSDKWEGNINVSVDLTQIVPNSGRITVELRHLDVTTHTKTQEFFYDSEPNTAVLSGVTIQETTASRITNYLSGVQFYSLQSPFTIDINDIDYLNGNSYPLVQVEVHGDDFGLPQLNLHGANLTGWVQDWDDIDDSYNNTNWQITAVNFCHNGDASTQANTVDWGDGALVDSNHQNILINTWSQQSDELSEYFHDEVYRKLSDKTTAWDSTQDLRTYDHTDHAQVICGVLQIPDTDYTTYNPLTNPDYSGYSGKEYYRSFTDNTSSVRGSAWLDIQGFTLDDLIHNRIEMWFFIPGRWASECYVHTPAVYNFGTFNGDDDPIRVNDSTTNNIHISFGTLGLDNTHNELQLRLVINDSNIKPEQIVLSW